MSLLYRNIASLEMLDIKVEVTRSRSTHYVGFYHQECRLLPRQWTFVFGSNLAGRHGAGAALAAKNQYGCPPGHANGFHSSQSGDTYAIPTKDTDIQTLPLDSIQRYVRQFVDYTQKNEKVFYVTPIGTGLAGYSHEQIAPLFLKAQNCVFPVVWKKFLCVSAN